METTPSIVLFRGLLSSKIEQLAGKTAGDLNFFLHHANPVAINFIKISPSAERSSNLHFTAGI
jgi:hypothetical protein